MNTLRSLILRLVLMGISAAVLLSVPIRPEAAFFEKTYVVEKDQGKDILCDEYVVRKGDWVFQLLRQRGDIAYKDFPKFLRIFKRLNPGVENIDLIYPDQRLLIPLRILEPDTLEGQASGTVSIPVITITTLPEAVKAQADTYVVQHGDWISRLISERFGPVGSEAYRQGLDLFMRMNRDIKNINKIRVGQKIRLPDPAIRDQVWYPEIFDESGDLVVEAKDLPETQEPEVPATETPESEIEPEPVAVDLPVQPPVVTASAQLPEPEPLPEPPAKTPPVAQPEAEAETVAETEKTAPQVPDEPVAAALAEVEEKSETPPEPAPEPAPAPVIQRFADKTVFGKAARILNADLLDNGEYFFPRKRRSDLKLDLSDTPVIEFNDGRRLLFTRTQWLPPGDQMVIQDHWKNLEVILLEGNPGLIQLLEMIIPVIDADGYENRVTFNDRGVSVVLRGRFIYDAPGQKAKICLNIISDPVMRVPRAVCDYLEHEGIIVRDWVESGDMSGWIMMSDTSKPAKLTATRADISDPAQFVSQIADFFGYRYQQNVEVSFPYAGFQVKAAANMLSFGNQSEVLIDYGSMQGDAIRAIEETGFKIVQIPAGVSEDRLIRMLAEVSPIGYTTDPVFWTARRPRIYNPSIQVPGYFLTADSGGQKREVLLTRSAIPDALKAYFGGLGIRLMRMY